MSMHPSGIPTERASFDPGCITSVTFPNASCKKMGVHPATGAVSASQGVVGSITTSPSRICSPLTYRSTPCASVGSVRCEQRNSCAKEALLPRVAKADQLLHTKNNVSGSRIVPSLERPEPRWCQSMSMHPSGIPTERALFDPGCITSVTFPNASCRKMDVHPATGAVSASQGLVGAITTSPTRICSPLTYRSTGASGASSLALAIIETTAAASFRGTSCCVEARPCARPAHASSSNLAIWGNWEVSGACAARSGLRPRTAPLRCRVAGSRAASTPGGRGTPCPNRRVPPMRRRWPPARGRCGRGTAPPPRRR